MFPCRWPENGSVFSVHTAPIGGTRGQNRSVFDENRLIGTAMEMFSTILRFFSGPNFLSDGSLANKTGPQPTKCPPAPPQSGHNLGPRDTWDPKQGSPGPHLACDQIGLAPFHPERPPRPGTSTFSASLVRLGPQAAVKFPQTPQNPVNRKLGPQEAATIESAKYTKLRNANAVPMGQNVPENSPVAHLGLAGNVWFNLCWTPGPHPPWAGDRPQNPVNCELPEKAVKHHPTSPT